MQGKDTFTQADASRIRYLLDKKVQQSGKAWQKPIRDELRSMGFYISDYGGYAFTVQDFHRLVIKGGLRSGVKATPPHPIVRRYRGKKLYPCSSVSSVVALSPHRGAERPECRATRNPDPCSPIPVIDQRLCHPNWSAKMSS